MNVVRIEYCVKCRWLLRAAWLAQEMLSTFQEELDGVTLVPGRTAGVFNITLGSDVLWSREKEGRFPEAKEIKRRLRERIAPDTELGHSDR